MWGENTEQFINQLNYTYSCTSIALHSYSEMQKAKAKKPASTAPLKLQ